MVPDQMKKRRGILIFAAGLLAGWLVRGGQGPAHAPSASGTETKMSRTRAKDQSKVTDDAKWAPFGKRMQALDSEALEKIRKDLSPQDRLQAIRALASQSGMHGVSANTRYMMKKIVEDWTDENHEDAWNAAQRTTDQDLRTFMLTVIVERLADRDPERAAMLELEEVANNPGFETTARGIYLASCLRIGAVEYMDALKKFPFTGGVGIGSTAELAPNFDFQFLADNLARVMKEHVDFHPSTFPADFYTGWAKKDPEAAFESWSNSPSILVSDLNDIIVALEQKSPGSSADWLVAKLQDSSKPREKMIRELGWNSTDGLDVRIGGIAKAMPDNQAANAFLSDFAVFGTHGELDRYGFAISGLPSPEARLAVFRRMREQNVDPGIDKIGDTQLQTWGITRQQLDEIFANGSGN